MGDTASTDEWIYHTSSTEVLIAKSWFLPYERTSLCGEGWVRRNTTFLCRWSWSFLIPLLPSLGS